MHVPTPSRSDVALTAGLLVLGQLTTWLRLDTDDAFAGGRLANATLAALVVLPLLWCRRFPAAAAGASAAILSMPHLFVELDVTVLAGFVPLIVVTAACGYHGTARQGVTGAALAVAGMTVVSATTPVLRTPVSLLFNVLVLLSPWAAARALRHREERARRLGSALAHQRRQFDDRMARAIERERAEIARELHDIVAHGVSVMVVQIGGARMQSADSKAVSRSLLQAEEAGRQALADLRRMLGVLRAAPADALAGQPLPGLAQLDVLIAQASNAGLQVQTRLDGSADPLPPAVDVSAYRIVQEALTNVLKHSRADRADVEIQQSDGQLTIQVHDRGPARRAEDETGYGLVGIRERVAFLGGRAHADADGTGGWHVRVEIPMNGAFAPRVGAEEVQR